MESSSKGEEASSNKDTNKDKKNEETKEPELVSVLTTELLVIHDYWFVSYWWNTDSYSNTLCHAGLTKTWLQERKQTASRQRRLLAN